MRRRAGFTLVETLVALTVSGVLILLVSATFLAQNTFYANILQRGRLQDNARTAAAVVASDLRSLMPDGMVVADSARMVLRVPMALGAVCHTQGGGVSVYLPGGEAALDPSITARVATRDASGAWTYYTNTWASLQTGGSGAASACAGSPAFADTAGAADEFYDVAGAAAVGDVYMVYRETEFRIMTSVLDPLATALFRGPSGGTLVELATPMASDAHFSYRKGGGSWSNQVSSGLSAIDRVRIVSRVRGPAEAASQADMEFELVVDVPLRNVP